MTILEGYRRARRLKKTTSRNRNEHWYRNALQQEEQLHYVITSDHNIYLYHLEKTSLTWTPLGEYSKEQLTNPDLLTSHIEEVLEKVTIDPKIGISIVIQQVNDFILRGGRHIFDHLDYKEINELLKTTPEEVLDDPKAREIELKKRVFPLNVQQKELSHYLVGNIKENYDTFLQEWRTLSNEKNLPINTELLVAPPISSFYLSRLAEQKNPDSKQFFTLIIGKQTSFLAFYNDGKPVSYRILNHFGDSLPNQLSQTIQNTVVQLEVEEFSFYYSFSTENRGANEQLKRKLAAIQLEPVELDWNARELKHLGLAAIGDAIEQKNQGDQDAYPESLLQSFVDYDEKELASFPSQKEMKTLNFTDLFKLVAVVLTLLYLGFQGFRIYSMTTNEEWKVEPANVTILKATLQKYDKDKSQMNRDASLLKDRSKSWHAFEFLSHAFPFDQGFIAGNYEYLVSPILSESGKEVGLLREWKITGNANKSGAQRLTKMRSTDEMSKIFSELNFDSYNPEGEFRNLLVDIQISTEQNAITAAHPYKFAATITQRIEPQDPLALKL